MIIKQGTHERASDAYECWHVAGSSAGLLQPKVGFRHLTNADVLREKLELPSKIDGIDFL